MKGMVFKSFEAHVEKTYGEDTLDLILDQPELSAGGAFTSVGNYPPSDLVCMVGALSKQTGQPVPQHVRQFGVDLFGVLAESHAEIMTKFKGCLELLAGIESVIHRDVRKLYPEAQLPRFDVEAHEEGRFLRLVYRSARPFADLAEGLIHGAIAHFGVSELARVSRENLAEDGTHAAFEITIDQPAT